MTVFRGLARNLLRGQRREFGDGCSQQGLRTLLPEARAAHAEYLTERPKFRAESDFTWYHEDMSTHVPLGYATIFQNVNMSATCRQ